MFEHIARIELITIRELQLLSVFSLHCHLSPQSLSIVDDVVAVFVSARDAVVVDAAVAVAAIAASYVDYCVYFSPPIDICLWLVN